MKENSHVQVTSVIRHHRRTLSIDCAHCGFSYRRPKGSDPKVSALPWLAGSHAMDCLSPLNLGTHYEFMMALNVLEWLGQDGPRPRPERLSLEHCYGTTV